MDPKLNARLEKIRGATSSARAKAASIEDPRVREALEGLATATAELTELVADLAEGRDHQR